MDQPAKRIHEKETHVTCCCSEQVKHKNSHILLHSAFAAALVFEVLLRQALTSSTYHTHKSEQLSFWNKH